MFCETFQHHAHHCFRFDWNTTTLIAAAAPTGIDQSVKEKNSRPRLGLTALECWKLSEDCWSIGKVPSTDLFWATAT